MDPKIEPNSLTILTQAKGLKKLKIIYFYQLSTKFLLLFLPLAMIFCGFSNILKPHSPITSHIVNLKQRDLKVDDLLIDLSPLKDLKFVGQNGSGTILQNKEIAKLFNDDKLNITFIIDHQNSITTFNTIPKNLFNDDQLTIKIEALDSNVILNNYPFEGFAYKIKNLETNHDYTIEVILYIAVSFIVVLIGLGTFFSIRKLRR